LRSARTLHSGARWQCPSPPSAIPWHTATWLYPPWPPLWERGCLPPCGIWVETSTVLGCKRFNIRVAGAFTGFVQEARRAARSLSPFGRGVCRPALSSAARPPASLPRLPLLCHPRPVTPPRRPLLCRPPPCPCLSRGPALRTAACRGARPSLRFEEARRQPPPPLSVVLPRLALGLLAPTHALMRLAK
jgi:hypothetical protein